MDERKRGEGGGESREREGGENRVNSFLGVALTADFSILASADAIRVLQVSHTIV